MLTQKKQKLPIMHTNTTKDMNCTQSQWQEMDELCRSTIKLHISKSIYFFMLECETYHAPWKMLCSTYEKEVASNKVFLMQKLFNLFMKESASVSNHINEFDSLFA